MKHTPLIMPLLIVPLLAAQDAKPTTLKEAFGEHFHMGAAVGRYLFVDEKRPTRDLVAKQFNSTSSKNLLKWGPFNPRPGVYRFEPADNDVAFANRHKMYVVGHVLYWHNQTPTWVFRDGDKPITREKLLQRMRERVRVVAKRYGDKIDAWDVVNESIIDSGKLRNRDWTRIIGDDFIEQAFRIADQELPRNVELIYNDYSMAGKHKRAAVVKMVGEFTNHPLFDHGCRRASLLIQGSTVVSFRLVAMAKPVPLASIA